MSGFPATGVGLAIFRTLSRQRIVDVLLSEGADILNSFLGDNVRISPTTRRLQLVNLTTNEKHDVHAEGASPAVVVNPVGEP